MTEPVWFSLALTRLLDAFDEPEGGEYVNGIEFLDVYLGELGFFETEDETDQVVRDSIAAFEDHIRPHVQVENGYIWRKQGSVKAATGIKIQTSADLSEAWNPPEVFSKKLSDLSSDDRGELVAFYGQLIVQGDAQLVAECAHRLACSIEMSDDTYRTKAENWQNAGEKAAEANAKSFRHFEKASYYFARDHWYQEAAECLSKTVHEYEGAREERLKLIRRCHSLYHQAGDKSEVKRVFELEQEVLNETAGRIEKIGRWLFWLVSDYAESPKRVVITAVGVVVLFSLLHLAAGIETKADNIIDSFGVSLYFSTVTFTTLGYGDFAPAAGFWGRAIAAIEALLGLVIASLFLVSVVRKYSR